MKIELGFRVQKWRKQTGYRPNLSKILNISKGVIEMKEYKIEIFRTNKNVFYSSKQLETFINNLADSGWLVKSLIYHEEVLCYEIFCEKEKA